MLEYRVVDVFAETKYAGNPLAVLPDAAGLDGEAMQALAREFNLAETTFVTGRSDGGFDVRIFTPGFEVPFAGHPTLGTAAVLRAEHGLGDHVVLNLGVGPVPVAFGADGLAWLDAPAATFGEERARAEGAALLGLAEADLDPELPVQDVTAGIGFLFVPLAGLDALKRARLDLDVHGRLLPPDGCVYLFCRESYEPGRDIAARMFFDAGGVREDPATGSASGCLAFYLLHHRVFGDGPFDLTAEQGHEISRPSLIHIRARNEPAAPRVQVGGRTIDIARGQLV